MYIFLNERCIDDRDNPIDENSLLTFLKENINCLYELGFHIQTRISAFKHWSDAWDVPSIVKTAILEIIYKLKDIADQQLQFYYIHYFHKNLNAVTHVTNTSLSCAVECLSYGRKISILNIPVSHYCGRLYVPVIKSPFSPASTDSFFNLRCFSDCEKIINYTFLEEEVKPLFLKLIEDKELANTRYNTFSASYESMLANFNFKDWCPYQKDDTGSLLNNYAFPASNYEALVNEIIFFHSTIKGNYEEKKAQYNLIGGLAAKIHGYRRNDLLSSTYQFEIYEAGAGRGKLLLSVDTESGEFEVIDFSGTALVVHHFSGLFKSPYRDLEDIGKHSLKNISRHMFLF